MSPKRIAALAISGALLAGGTGVAIATVTKDEGEKAEQAVLDDAAKRLDVSPQKLRDALAAAQDAQLDQAVKDGKLTREQADAIKQRRKQHGRVLGGGPFGKPHLRGGPFKAMRGPVVLNLSKALGISREKLHEQLRAGKSVADIAKAQGKSLADVRRAVKADAKARADKAVDAGDLTRAQADKMLDHLDEALEHLDRLPAMRRHLHREGPPELEPGRFVPGDEVPRLKAGIFS